MIKEFILMPTCIGASDGFIIPKKRMKLDFNKEYRIRIEEV